ncbi:MAG: hypothetical protein QXN34_02205 [Archaeoglobaceae archaeon]
MRFIYLLALIALTFVPIATALETLTKNNYSLETKITPEKEYYFAGELISVEYKIYPKTSDDKVKIGGDKGNPRSYYFRTPLLEPKWILDIKYASVAGPSSVDFRETSIVYEVKYLDENGLDYLKLNVTGKLPDTVLRIKNLDVIVAAVEEAAVDALKPITIKLVNKTAFSIEIEFMRKSLTEAKNKLEAEGVKYDEREFKDAENLLKTVEQAFNDGDYSLADEKIETLKSKIENLTSLADKLRAEDIYNRLSNEMSNLSVKLEEVQLLIQNLRGSENYENLSTAYATLKARGDEYKLKLVTIKEYLNQEKFTKAYEEAKKIEDGIYRLKTDLEDLYNKSKVSPKPTPSYDFFAELKFYAPYLAVVGVLSVAIVAIARFRKRRKWDELR